MPLSLEATEWLAKPTVGIRPEAPRLPWSHKGSFTQRSSESVGRGPGSAQIAQLPGEAEPIVIAASLPDRRQVQCGRKCSDVSSIQPLA